MDETRWVARYAATALLIVGGLEWLLGRTISRMAAAPVLEGTPRDIIVTLGQIGLFLVSPALLLAFCLVGVGLWTLARRSASKGDRKSMALVAYLAIAAAANLAYTILPGADWLTTAFNLLMWIALCGVALRFAFVRRASVFARLGVGLAALAYSGWYVYVLAQQIGASEQASLWAISLGELWVVLAPVALFCAVALQNGEWKHRRRWILPVVLALGFSGGSISDMAANQGFVGVFTTWSLGVNITWPWPIYAVALTLYVYAVLTCFSKKPLTGYANPNTGAGLLLLLLSGYNLQTSYQHLLALLALLLLSKLIVPFPAHRQVESSGQVAAPVPSATLTHNRIGRQLSWLFNGIFRHIP